MNAIVNVNIDKYLDRVFITIPIGRWGNRAQVTDGEALREYLRLLDIEKEQAKTEKARKKAEREARKNGTTLPAMEPSTPATSEQESDVTTNGSSGVSGFDAVSSTKRLISPKEPKLKAITDLLTETKEKLIGKYRGIAQPSSFMKGVYVIRKDQVDAAEEIIAEAKAKLTGELIPAFIEEFPAMMDRARVNKLLQGGLGPLYQATDYPQAGRAASRFTIYSNYLRIGVSDQISDKLRAQKEKEFSDKIQNALETSMEALRQGFAELVDHAVEKLTVAPGERPKTFRDSLVGNFADFIATFRNKDFGDEALASLVAKAESIIAPEGKPLDPDKLRKYASVRDNVQKGFAEIQTALDGMIVERKGRKIDLSEED